MRIILGLVFAVMGSVVLFDVLRGESSADGNDMGEFQLFPTDAIKWREGPPSLPKGAMIAVLEGDPAKEGPFVFRVKLPDGYRIPPHTHPKTERVTVISGTFNIGMGEKFDAKAAKAMPAGTYGHWPAGMKHFVWAKGETVLQFHGMGPWSIQYVKPEDDPRNQKRPIGAGIRSGPQADEQLPGQVQAVVVRSEARDLVGKRIDLVEWYGPKPAVLVFARDLDDPVANLVKKLDDELAKSGAARAKQANAAVVLLSDDDGLESELKDFAENRTISHVTLAIDRSTGPPKWRINPEADVTIILYERYTVKENHAYGRGALREENIDRVAADVSTLFGR